MTNDEGRRGHVEVVCMPRARVRATTTSSITHVHKYCSPASPLVPSALAVALTIRAPHPGLPSRLLCLADARSRSSATTGLSRRRVHLCTRSVGNTRGEKHGNALALRPIYSPSRAARSRFDTTPRAANILLTYLRRLSGSLFWKVKSIVGSYREMVLTHRCHSVHAV